MSHVDLLSRYRTDALGVEPGCFTNWLGLKTDAGLFDYGEHLRGRVLADLPIPDDRAYGTEWEYASLLTAIEEAAPRGRFTAVELGAGWGPWISAAGKVCQRLGVGDVTLVGVEADEGRMELMAQHMRRNGLTARLIHGAAWSEDTRLKFPKIHVEDHGAAVSETGDHADPDYRGLPQQYQEAPAFGLATICQGLGVIDYMHWDIQGAELRVFESSIALLNDRARHLFIGTHSRPIEGRLIEHFYQQGWDVVYHNPCQFTFDRSKPTIEGMTTRDGEIVARNPRLA